MSNQKVPQLPILTAVTDADLLYIVDVSDTTDDPTGSSKQITREELLTNVSYIDFNTTATTTHLEGRISWNDTLKTLEVDTENSDVQLKVGHEMVIRVNNQTGGVLSKGRAVYINGEQGNRPTVTYGTYTGDSTSAAIVGLIADDIPNNQNGYVIVSGLLEGIDTSGYTSGTPLYLFTGGTLTSTKPQAPNHDVRIAKVVVQDATIGSLYVSVQNGYELDEIHDVRITSVSENDVLVRSTYNGSPVWVNTKTMSGLTYVGVTTISATTISGTTFYGNGTNLTGVVKGSGTANYLPKWTGTTGQGNSLIQDNGTGVGISSSPVVGYKLYVNGTVFGQAGGSAYGVVGQNTGDITGTYVGVYGAGSSIEPYNDSIYVGGKFIADGSVNNLNYAAWFMDGTEALNKVLISATADGKTNWSSNLTGLTSVSAATISGGTMVITTTPTNNDSPTQVLTKNATTGVVEMTSPQSPGLFNYGLANAIMTGNFLT